MSYFLTAAVGGVVVGSKDNLVIIADPTYGSVRLDAAVLLHRRGESIFKNVIGCRKPLRYISPAKLEMVAHIGALDRIDAGSTAVSFELLMDQGGVRPGCLHEIEEGVQLFELDGYQLQRFLCGFLIHRR